MKNALLCCLAFFILVNCQNEPKKEASTEMKKDTVESPVKYKLSPFAASEAYPDAKITGMTYDAGKFNFEIEGNGYELGVQTPDAPQKMCANSGKGQHIHLIVGKAPYAAKYVSEFEHEVPDGDHSLLAFLSRSYHESIKTSGASVALNVSVKDGAITKSEVIASPTLFYSRPKGTYVGKANTDKVMLDFYVLNATLGNDYKVKAEINGEESHIIKWQPYYIEGLPMGENTITLTLLDANGNVVDSPINPVSRTFTLKADPVEG